MTIGEKIYELRSSRNMSLREFAQLTGVTHTTIARIESLSMGPQKIFLDTIYLICKNLNYSFGQFLMETGYLPEYDAKYENVKTNTPDEEELIGYFRELSPYLKGVALDTVRAMAGNNNSNVKKKTH